MFISKKRFNELCARVTNLESTVANLPVEFDEKLCGFATDVEEMQNKLSEVDGGIEAMTKDREREKAFFDGFTNIMSYEVPNGRGKQTQ